MGNDAAPLFKVVVKKKRFPIETFFSTTTYAALPYFETLLWKTV